MRNPLTRAYTVFYTKTYMLYYNIKGITNHVKVFMII